MNLQRDTETIENILFFQIVIIVMPTVIIATGQALYECVNYIVETPLKSFQNHTASVYYKRLREPVFRPTMAGSQRFKGANGYVDTLRLGTSPGACPDKWSINHVTLAMVNVDRGVWPICAGACQGRPLNSRDNSHCRTNT